MRPGGAFLSLTYMAGERVIPGYGGGMSSAKAALEADTRTLAFEAGRRWGVRVNAISAGPWASRAASRHRLHRHDDRVHRGQLAAARGRSTPREVGHAAAFLCSPLAAAITGSVVYVDNGYHAMGMAVPERSERELNRRSSPLSAPRIDSTWATSCGEGAELEWLLEHGPGRPPDECAEPDGEATSPGGDDEPVEQLRPVLRQPVVDFECRSARASADR